MLCIYMPWPLLYFLRNSLTNNVCTSNEDQMLNVLQTTQNTEQGRNRTPRTRKTLNTQQHQHVKQTRTCKRERPPRTIFTGTKINMRSAHRKTAKTQRHPRLQTNQNTAASALKKGKPTTTWKKHSPTSTWLDALPRRGMRARRLLNLVLYPEPRTPVGLQETHRRCRYLRCTPLRSLVKTTRRAKKNSRTIRHRVTGNRSRGFPVTLTQRAGK